MLCAEKQILRTVALLPLLEPPHPKLNQALTRTRIEVSRLGIREVERKDPLRWLLCCVLRLRILTDGGGIELVSRVKRVWNAGCAQV